MDVINVVKVTLYRSMCYLWVDVECVAVEMIIDTDVLDGVALGTLYRVRGKSHVVRVQVRYHGRDKRGKGDPLQKHVLPVG